MAAICCCQLLANMAICWKCRAKNVLCLCVALSGPDLTWHQLKCGKVWPSHIVCSHEERSYLLDLYNHYFVTSRNAADIQREFAGVRPLLGGSNSASSASREYTMHWQQQLLTVTGGKWTTARALAKQVVLQVSESS